MNDLQTAIAKRDQFLKDHPHLQSYQDQISNILDRTPEKDRMHVLGILMSTKLIDLQKKLLELTSMLSEEVK